MQLLKVNNLIFILVAIVLFAARGKACMTADIVYTNDGFIYGTLEDAQDYWIYRCSIDTSESNKDGFDEADDRRGYKAAKMNCEKQYDIYGNTYETTAYITRQTAKDTDVQDRYAIIYESLGRRMDFGLEWHDKGEWSHQPYRLTAKVWCP